MATYAQRIPGGPSATPSSGQAILGNAADRRMCAGVYLDRAFRDRLLGGVYNDRNKRVAPSHGFDVIVVLQHAWRAWWLELGQHLALLAVLALALIRVPLETVMAASALAIWSMVRILPGWVGGVAGYYSGRGAEPEIRQMRARGKLLGSGLLVAFLALVVAMVAATDSSVRVGKLGGGWPSRTGLAGAAEIVAFCGAVVAAAAAVRVIWLGQLRSRDPQRGRRTGRRLLVIDGQQHHPFTVHSGFRPFIGSGANVRSWSFAQRLIHHKKLGTERDVPYDVPPFTAQELITCLHKMISELRDDVHIETRLPGLAVADHVFVEGTNAAPFRQVPRSAAGSRDVQEAIAEAVARPSDVARHYLACRVDSWGGEVVTSVFVHVTLQGRTLYLEFSTYALLPTRTEYRIIDEPGGTGVLAVIKAIGKGLLSLPDELLAARRVAVAPAQLWAALRPRKDLTFKERASSRADIGAAVSAREEAAAEADESYFQYQDILQHSKIIERRLIATVGDYLKELGVDTSEFWERARAILNNGVINAGSGTVNITGSAVGDQATVTNEAPPES